MRNHVFTAPFLKIFSIKPIDKVGIVVYDAYNEKTRKE